MNTSFQDPIQIDSSHDYYHVLHLCDVGDFQLFIPESASLCLFGDFSKY